MALKFRRGTTAQKSGSLAFGEPYVNTTLGTLQIGLDNGDVTLASAAGLISGSSQVSYPQLSNIPSGIISSSTQIDTLFNIDGLISGSSQLTSSFDDRYVLESESGSFARTSVSNTFDSYQTITDYVNVTGPSGGDYKISGTSIFNSTSTYIPKKKVTGGYQDSNISDNGTTITLGSNTVVTGTIVASGTSLVSGSSQITFSGISSLPTLVSGSSQITLSSTTGGGTSADVQFGSLGIGMVASGTSGRIDASGDIVAYSTSDRNFKENITPIPNALEKISKISGNTYDWKEDMKDFHGFEGNDVGVIAQEIEEVLPQLVTTRETGYKAVKYDKLVALLIEGIKEQQTQIHNLTLEVENLKKQKGL